MSNGGRPRQNGRPRDPELDSRISAVVIELFGEGGWQRVTMQRVAARAGVSKVTVYLRASNRDELLEDVLHEMLDPIASIDEGSVREDLRKLADLLFELYTGARGPAIRRMLVEQPANPQTARRWTDLKASLVRSARSIVIRGIRRGDLPEKTQPSLILDMVAGAVFNHANATPAELSAKVRSGGYLYTRTLVDYILEPLDRHIRMSQRTGNKVRRCIDG
jgi:AcrR family transcriptional regulator